MCPPRPLAATAERTLKALESPPGVAEDEARTRDIDLGRVALYQLSYSRPPDAILEGMCSDSYSDSGEEGV